MESFTLGTHTFTGRVIGAATSEAQHHNHPEDYLQPIITDPGVRRRKCSACRWLETTLYRTSDGKYVIHTNGRSIVPGEVDYERVTFTASAYELVEIGTVKNAPEPYIPLPTARALAQAAEKDDAVQEAYVNRAVVR